MATVGETKTHKTVLGLNEGSQGRKAVLVSNAENSASIFENLLGSLRGHQQARSTEQNTTTYATRVGLNINTPLCGVEVERLESTFTAENLELVDVLIAAVVPGVGETLRVLVGEDGAIGLHRGLGGQVLQGIRQGNIMFKFGTAPLKR